MRKPMLKANPRYLVHEMKQLISVAQREEKLASNPMLSFAQTRHHLKLAEQALQRFRKVRAQVLTEARRSR